LKDRYGRDQKAISYLERLEKSTSQIEDKIFFILQIDPDELQLLGRPGDLPAHYRDI
jgi:hypothetical protein